MSEKACEPLLRHASQFFLWVLAGYLIATLVGVLSLPLVPWGPVSLVLVWGLCLGVPFGVGINLGHQLGYRHGLSPCAAGLVGLGGMALYVLATTVFKLATGMQPDPVNAAPWSYSVIASLLQMAVAGTCSAGGAYWGARKGDTRRKQGNDAH